MINTTRRDLLRASPALLAPGLLPLPSWAASVTFDNVAPVTPTPCLALFHEWHRLDSLFQHMSDEEGDETFQRLLEVERRLAAEPITSLQDLAAKVLILTQIREDFGGTLYAEGVLAEMEEIARGAEA